MPALPRIALQLKRQGLLGIHQGLAAGVRVGLARSLGGESRQVGQKIGMTGFEPAAPSSRTKCATKLRYIPIQRL